MFETLRAFLNGGMTSTGALERTHQSVKERNKVDWDSFVYVAFVVGLFKRNNTGLTRTREVRREEVFTQGCLDVRSTRWGVETE